MFFDLIANQPYRWFRQCEIDLKKGVPPMDFDMALMREAVPFKIDDVASHYFNHPRDYVPHDFHALVPRYPISWFEFSQPKRGLVGDHWNDYEAQLKEVAGPGFDISKMTRGIYLRAWDRYKEEDVKSFRSVGASVKVSKDARWLYRAMVFLSMDGAVVSNGFSGISFQVDDLGDIIFFGGEKHPYVFDIPVNEARLMGIEYVRGHVTGSIMPVVMALSLIQHKDVFVQPVPGKNIRVKAGSRRARRVAAKMARDESFFEHHTIQVRPKTGFQKKEPGLATGKKKGVMAWHRMPGGFRTYGGTDPQTGKPKGLLFGKHKGTFYFSSFERGTKNDGTITKDYEVHDQ